METLRQEFQDALDQKQIEPGLLKVTASSWSKYQIIGYDPIDFLSPQSGTSWNLVAWYVEAERTPAQFMMAPKASSSTTTIDEIQGTPGR